MADFIAEKKPLGIWTLTALVVGNMIGSGIFLLPADLAKFGSATFIAWMITALGAFFLAMVLSRLSQLVPRNGGPFAYAREGLGNFIGFQTVYNHWIAIWVGNLGLVVAFISYLAMFWPVFSQPIVGLITSVIIIWTLTLVNISGIRHAGVLQLITVILKLIPIIALVGFGVWYFDLVHIKGALTLTGQSPHSISVAASLTLWAFIGVESATVPYGYVKNPQRNIPLATILGTLIAAAVYIVSTTVVIGIVPPEALTSNASAFVIAAGMIFGGWGKWFMIVGALISCFGCINGWTMLQGQVAMAAADNNLFPEIFGIKNKHGVPVLGLAITAILECIILLFTLNKDATSQFQLIILMASLAALIPYLYTSLAALLILKKQSPTLLFKDKVLFLIATLAAIYAFWMITISGTKVIFYGSILVFTSALLYGWGYGDEKNQ